MELYELAVPRLHLNGTSKASLLEQIDNAYTALGTAYNAVREMAPNGRDYYVYNDGMATLAKAEDQHRARLRVLDGMRRELEQMAEKLDAQGRR